MNAPFKILFLALIITACGTATPDDKPGEPAADTTPRVTGIGGIFFESADLKIVREWYGNNLGLVRKLKANGVVMLDSIETSEA